MSLNRPVSLRSLMRLSALRQAVVLTATFLVLLVLAGIFSVFEFERVFEDRIEDELATRFAVVSDDVRANGFDQSRYPRTVTEVVARLDPQMRISSGFHDDLPRQRGRNDDDFGFERGQWMYLVGRVGDDTLVVGTNVGRRDEFLEVILQSMGLAGLAAAILALCIGLLFGLRTQRRITAISGTLATAANGDLTARVRADADRDDVDALAHQVDDTISQLETLIRQTRDFSANIAHDLKTPLARLRIRLETALTAELGDGDSADDIGAALEQADDVIAIFDAFLRIAKLESGTAQAKFAPVDLGALIAQVAEIYDPVVEDSGRVLKIISDGPATIQGDRVLLVQLLANLIENAIRHTPVGTQVTLIAKGTTLGVADTGPGIPADEYARVTQPLYRLDKSRSEDGAGLGLSLVKTIADVHGALLSLSPNPAVGSGGLQVLAEFSQNR